MTMDSEPFIFEPERPLVIPVKHGVYCKRTDTVLFNLYNYEIQYTVVEIMNRHVWGFDVLVMKAHLMIKVCWWNLILMNK